MTHRRALHTHCQSNNENNKFKIDRKPCSPVPFRTMCAAQKPGGAICSRIGTIQESKHGNSVEIVLFAHQI